ncbi:hypothetical protein EL26_04655 [Tumebacillus flagellatus]|uniref:Uncharacterized protein n=1 Tax=Tumebacillus flagellatus TaxID=1157490 RepID=A0A074LWE3_9BACL|nr:hypothetical protein EL26_04655 [Tumebacillus flagellatus]
MKGSKHNYHIAVESRGTRSATHQDDKVFDSSQLYMHVVEQVGDLMQHSQAQSGTLLFMGNPDIPRIRHQVAKIDKSLDRLEFVRLWVQKDGTVLVEAPKEMASTLQKLGI